MDSSRRHLLQSLGATTVISGFAGCTWDPRDDLFGNECRRSEDSFESMINESSGRDLDPFDEAWPMRHNDAAGTGYTDRAGPQTNVERVRLFNEEGFGEIMSAVIGNGKVYVTDSNWDELVVIDPTQGEIEWRYEQLADGGSTPALADELVLVASENGLHALDAMTGERRWHNDTASFDAGVLIAEDDVAYASTRGDRSEIVAVDITTGETVWRINGQHLAAVADGQVYFGEELRAVDTADGSDLWHVDDVNSRTTVSVRDGTVYAGTLRIVYAFDAEDGSQLWRFRGGPEAFQTPTIAPDAVALGTDTTHDGGGNVYVLDSEDGSERWCANFGDRNVTAPTIADDIVYLAAEGVVQARQLNDGEPLWTGRDNRLQYTHQALSGGSHVVVGQSRRGQVVDAFVES